MMNPANTPIEAVAESRHDLIFVVEDEPEISRLICRTLQEYGFDVRSFRTGQELLGALASARPRLCLVDLGLPDIDGMELVGRLWKTHDCPVLILTGRSHVADRVVGLETGADDYIVKPFEPRELIARIRVILRRYARSTEPEPATAARCARFAGWRFDPDSNRLTSPAGHAVELSVSEARLLAALLQRPNRILTREQLAGRSDLDPLDRSIDVRISRLRQKLEDSPASPTLIKTIYGAGYLFAAGVAWD
ncbi:response regulator transcription factor [Pseudogulbenkiania sp. MAI-1]|uniref:response regulator transcription factor n=1 Tax=Pseudogulbenkiania sp. MAI-1 TaxID=990370 RepID=UPI0004A2A4D1|nr:response regulator transcription factor [Pseudogulbenkiania sp. MAI-1]